MVRKKRTWILICFVLVVTLAFWSFPTTAFAAEDDSPGMFAKILGQFLSGIPQAFIKVLQLQDFHELVYGQNDKSVWGVFTPKTYSKVIYPLQSAFKVIAWSVALVMIYLTAIRLARSGANSSRRVKLYSLLENWVVGSILIGGSVYLLDVVFGIANGVVAFFAPPKGQIIDFMQYEPPTGAFNFIGQTIITPLIMLAILGVLFALNFIYLQRYFVLIVLISLAPIFAVTWFSDKTRKIFENWFKEIVCLAAMPVGHAFFLYIYFKLDPTGTVSPVGKLFFLILMIPMSDMLRGMLGVGGSGKGINEMLLMGLGLGASIGLGRSLIALGSAAINSNNLGNIVQSPFAVSNAITQTSSVSGAASSSSTTGLAPSLAQVMGNTDMLHSFQQRVDGARNIGSKVGRVFGGLGGAVMGAAMGSNMTAAMGSIAGTQLGDPLGRGFGGAVSVAGARARTFVSPGGMDSFYENLGQGNVRQTLRDADGKLVFQEGFEQDNAYYDNLTPDMGYAADTTDYSSLSPDKTSFISGTVSSVSKDSPVKAVGFEQQGGQAGTVSSVASGQSFTAGQQQGMATVQVVDQKLAREFGRANYATIKAQAYAGIPFVGSYAARKAIRINDQATVAAQQSLPNPLQIEYAAGDLIQKVTTNSGSHYYKVGQDGGRDYLFSTAEINPMATAENPYITESRIVETKEGDLVEKVIRQGYSGNFVTARGVQPALILNRMAREK